MSGVDLVVNTFERSYREVLAPGFFPAIAEQNRFTFERRVALVNNVDDPSDARKRAEALVAAGEIDAFEFVADHLDDALRRTGLTHDDLGRIAYFSDCSLVAATLDGAPWLLYWDADVRLERPCDWITPSLELFESDPRVAVANPAWEAPTLEQETLERSGDFALGHGFSDQVWLVRRSEFGAPIYGRKCLARHRYPMAHVAYIFEARVDAWMRHNGRLRATYTPVRYLHPEGSSHNAYPPANLAERMKLVRSTAVNAFLARSPWRPRCCRAI